MPATIKTVTLGCKVNQYETEFVREGLLRAGFREAAAEEPADLCVVNTCTVTNEGDAKSRQLIRRLARENPACADRRDGVLCHASAGGSRRAARGRRGGHGQARVARPARPLWRRRHPDRNFRASAAGSEPTSRSKTAVCCAAATASSPKSAPIWPADRCRIFSTKCGDSGTTDTAKSCSSASTSDTTASIGTGSQAEIRMDATGGPGAEPGPNRR